MHFSCNAFSSIYKHIYASRLYMYNFIQIDGANHFAVASPHKKESKPKESCKPLYFLHTILSTLCIPYPEDLEVP